MKIQMAAFCLAGAMLFATGCQRGAESNGANANSATKTANVVMLNVPNMG